MTRQLSWGLRGKGPADIQLPAVEIDRVTPDWAWGGSRGAGIRVCVIDSGIEGDHPLVGPITASYEVFNSTDGPQVRPTDHVDTCGHGTACAGLIRAFAPDCELYSVRVLGERFSGTGSFMLAGLRWAVEQGYDVINMSLSTTRTQFAHELHELADEAYFRRTAIVASAHNTPVVSFPWRFCSVLSVGSHQEQDPNLYLYNPSPPVEFFAQGQDVRVAWPGGGTTRTTGNSFATPRIAGLCALTLAKNTHS
ncbi:S8 family serine peptidase [Fodinicola feengrottensis]|uniref:S8 family serine peptidase n=1 Tax=Fodinicola feengrottensis TaxID=435914 RepID=UPI0024413A78|nr:S8 family serine peptidase [Fodinicola feengrottensis]